MQLRPLNHSLNSGLMQEKRGMPNFVVPLKGSLTDLRAKIKFGDRGKGNAVIFPGNTFLYFRLIKG